MTNTDKIPSTGAEIADTIEELSRGRDVLLHDGVHHSTDHLALVLCLHEFMGGDTATFARVTGLHESTISTIAEKARVLREHAGHVCTSANTARGPKRL